jgi:hypothetical protein
VIDFFGCEDTVRHFLDYVPNTAPVITCPPSVTVPNDPGLCGAVVNYNAVTFSDECPNAFMNPISFLPSGSTYPVGAFTNSYIAIDERGLSSTCSFTVTVEDTEAPAFTNAPSDFSDCNPISWTTPTVGDNCPASLPVSFQITQGATVIGTNVSLPYNFPSGTSTVTYTTTDAYGNVGTHSFNVTLEEASVAPTSVSSDKPFSNICIGEGITLTVQGGSLGNGASWKWYTGSCGGTLVGTGPTLTVSPTASTTYYVRAEGLCNTTTCALVTVVVSTSAPGSVTLNAPPASGGVGSTAVVSVNPVPGAAYYRWTSNLGHISAMLFDGVQGPYETPSNAVTVTFFQPQQNYQIRVVAVNACGRSNTASGHIRGTVGASAGISSGSGNFLACPGDVTSYTCVAIPGNSYYTWTLTPASAGTITGQGGLTVTVNWAPSFSGSATLCVQGQSTFNLLGPATCVTITNNAPAPAAPVGNLTPCINGNETYNVPAIPGATGYIWSTTVPGALITPAGTSASVQFNGSATGTLCVVAQSSCGLSSATCINLVDGEAGDPGVISGPINGMCDITGNYSLPLDPAVISYNWYSADPAVSFVNNGTNSVQVQFSSSLGFYANTISVDAQYACGIVTRDIYVEGTPAMPELNFGTASICQGTFNNTYTVTNVQANATYNWTINSFMTNVCLNTNNGCISQYVDWDGSGFEEIYVNASNNCGVSADLYLNVTCRLQAGTLEVNLFPNPTSGVATVEFLSGTADNLALEVTDLTGRIILSKEVAATAGMNQYTIDLSDAAKGMYMVRVTGNAGVQVVKRLAVE